MIVYSSKRFCKTSSAANRQFSERSSEITEDKLNEAYDVCEYEPLSNFLAVAIGYFIPQTTVHQIMTQYISITPAEVIFVQDSTKKIYNLDTNVRRHQQ